MFSPVWMKNAFTTYHHHRRPGSSREAAPRAGFTLVEVIVASVLLALIGLIIAQITTAVSRSIGLSNQGVDAAEQARLVFDRMEMDLASAVVRPDADFHAATAGGAGSNFLTFLSTLPSADPTGAGGFSNRRISLVAYRVAPSADYGGRTCLLRAGRAIGWNETDFMGVPIAAPLTETYPVRITDSSYPITISDDDFDALSPAVIQTVVGYQLRPDNEPARLANGTQIPNARGQIVYSPPVRGMELPASEYVDSGRIAALVVGLVVLDPKKLKLLNPASTSVLASRFTGTPQTDETPVRRWMEDTANLADLPDDVPLPVRQSVRLYERFFPLPLLGENAPSP